MRLLPPLIVIVLLASCGYKAPLYLPKPKPAAAKPESAPPPEIRKPDPS